ncbi:putative membrane protein [Xanthomonas euvesicatoria pv. vesicatoria str. 85-10]|uniref:Putative membrane protein n=1 Tax=Xanthomonas euvesicatoria pv. vesicatoria (strain 85-10) TaxID=316273 RepID=Q3BXB0_XANE5|nr:putative membrane protein [Xanthomonas euvesicatoria pv. vesicatoria str. 85-10]
MCSAVHRPVPGSTACSQHRLHCACIVIGAFVGVGLPLVVICTECFGLRGRFHAYMRDASPSIHT